MVTKYIIPASIECLKANLKFRKIVVYRPCHNEKLNKQTYRYKCERDSSAFITKELEPKIALINPSSLLDLNDGIRGKTIFVLTILPIGKPRVEKGSGRHKAQYYETNDFTFAKIEKIFPSIPTR